MAGRNKRNYKKSREEKRAKVKERITARQNSEDTRKQFQSAGKFAGGVFERYEEDLYASRFDVTSEAYLMDITQQVVTSLKYGLADVKTRDDMNNDVNFLYEPQLLIPFTLHHMARGASDKELAAEMSIGMKTFNMWRARYPEFDNAVLLGEQLSEAWWISQGRENLNNKDFNNGLWTKNMQHRYKWAGRQTTTNNTTIQQTNNVMMLTEEQQELILDKLSVDELAVLNKVQHLLQSEQNKEMTAVMSQHKLLGDSNNVAKLAAHEFDVISNDDIRGQDQTETV